MTMTEAKPLPRNRKVGPRVRAAAREVYLESVAAGQPMTGADLGRRFGCSDRWGREQIRDAKAVLPNGSSGALRPDATASAERTAHLPPAGSTTDDEAVPAERWNGVDHPSGSTPEPTATATSIPGTTTDPSDLTAVGSAGADGAVDGAGGSVRARKVIRWITTIIVIGVALAAARSSYDHQRVLVEMAGQHKAAWYLPLSVDGMMVIASMNMLLRRWEGEPVGWLTWCAMLLGGSGSLAANIAAAEPTLLGRVVAAWSPICLLVSYELLLQQLPSRKQGPK